MAEVELVLFVVVPHLGHAAAIDMFEIRLFVTKNFIPLNYPFFRVLPQVNRLYDLFEQTFMHHYFYKIHHATSHKKTKDILHRHSLLVLALVMLMESTNCSCNERDPVRLRCCPSSQQWW